MGVASQWKNTHWRRVSDSRRRCEQHRLKYRRHWMAVHLTLLCPRPTHRLELSIRGLNGHPVTHSPVCLLCQSTPDNTLRYRRRTSPTMAPSDLSLMENALLRQLIILTQPHQRFVQSHTNHLTWTLPDTYKIDGPARVRQEASLYLNIVAFSKNFFSTKSYHLVHTSKNG